MDLTNDENLISGIGVAEHLWDSDHREARFEVTSQVNKDPNHSLVPHFARGNHSGLRDLNSLEANYK